ncbi:hypothetical protein [Pygmaiobacter massiliensis]|uniref:hypothetical protein n=1 Tax=Pygmaiobacter massiliensis TaxID=1917873 RepID=UPI0011AF7FC3|nr:hypothetical protein [Pygmaiobacter massiliensis]
MPNQKDLNLEKYEISKYRYRELKNFCLQYDEKKQRLAALRGIGAVTYSNEPHGSGTSDPTAAKAERAQQLARDIELIEQTAMEVDSVNYHSLLANVTAANLPYEYLSPACGRRQFYEDRRKFFYLLDKKLNK